VLFILAHIVSLLQGLHGYGFRNLTPDSNNCVFYNDKIMSSDINVLCNLRWGRDIPFSSILFNILSDSNNEAAISFKRHRIEITDNAKLLELLPKYLAGDGSLWDMFHRVSSICRYCGRPSVVVAHTAFCHGQRTAIAILRIHRAQGSTDLGILPQ
jgi:hypothetical protein